MTSKYIVTSMGYDIIARRVGGINQVIPQEIALGTGTTEPTEDDVQLENEVARAVISSRWREGYNAYFKATFTSGAFTFTEAGLFNLESWRGFEGKLFIPNRHEILGAKIDINYDKATMSSTLEIHRMMARATFPAVEKFAGIDKDIIWVIRL